MPVKSDNYAAWGRVLTATGQRARPERTAALNGQVETRPGPAIGNLRSYGDAALNDGGMAVDMSRLDRLLAFDPATGVLEAEAGVRVSDIVATFAPQGWIPAVMPGTGFATLGGAIAADVHGKNHHKAGSFGQHVDSLRLIGADGKTREVSTSTEPEVFRATLGGMGLTGIVESARIRMTPCRAEYMDVRERRMPNLARYMEAFEASEAPYSVGWIDATATGADLGRGVLEEADFTDRPAPFAKHGKVRTVPRDAPGFLLSPPIVKAFNNLYYKRIPAAGRTRTRTLLDFFFPLDRLRNWNRLYGKRGFHQFQCVLPPDAAALVLDEMLRDVAASRLAAPLAVLKKMGPGRAGPMSFPMAGYTLAVDFPNREAARPLIEKLEDRTAEVGGRIYLAKDSCMRAGSVTAMYPEIDAFRATLAACDPQGVFQTDLSRRLNLRGAA